MTQQKKKPSKATNHVPFAEFVPELLEFDFDGLTNPPLSRRGLARPLAGPSRSRHSKLDFKAEALRKCVW